MSITSIASKCAFERTKNNYLPKRNRFLWKWCLGKFHSFNPFNPQYTNQTKISKSLSNQKKRSKGTKNSSTILVAVNREKKQQAATLFSLFEFKLSLKVQFPMAPWPHVVSSILLEPKTCPRWDTLRKTTQKKQGDFLCRNAVDSDRSLCLTNMRHKFVFSL